MRLDRVRHRDRPFAPATKVAAPVDPQLARSVFLQAWTDYLVVIVFIRSSDKYTLPLGLQAFSNKRNRLGPVMAVAVLLLDPRILVFVDRAADNAAGGPRCHDEAGRCR